MDDRVIGAASQWADTMRMLAGFSKAADHAASSRVQQGVVGQRRGAVAEEQDGGCGRASRLQNDDMSTTRGNGGRQPAFPATAKRCAP